MSTVKRIGGRRSRRDVALRLPAPRSPAERAASPRTLRSPGPADEGDSAGQPGPDWRPLRLAMIGQKGIPATYGGIERHVEELGSRLAGRGHDVTVYCRTTYDTERLATYRGMRLRYLPALGTKHLDAISHSAASTLAAMAARSDVVHYHALGPGLMSPLPRYLSTGKVVLTVHGLDHERAKWNHAAQAILTSAHWLSGHVPDETIVVSRELAAHYATRFGRRATYIPNGVDIPRPRQAQLIRERFGLAPGRYVLFVGRLVPEKAPDLLVRAFRRLTGDTKLVIVGDSSFSNGYVSELRRLAAGDPRIVLAGYCYGDLLAELYSNAGLFVLPSLLEGLPLTLLEALSYGIPVVVSRIGPHVEVLGADGAGKRLVQAGDEGGLTETMSYALRRVSEERRGARGLREKVLAAYRWSAVADETEQLYLDLVAGRVGGPVAMPAPASAAGPPAAPMPGPAPIVLPTPAALSSSEPR